MQVFLLALLTDDGSSAVVSYRERLAKHVGVVPDVRLEPHITLGAGETEDVEALIETLHENLDNCLAFDIRLSALGTFGLSNGVLFLSPYHTRELIALYERLYAVLEQRIESLNGLYMPGQWSSYCTLLMNLDAPQLVAGFEAALGHWPLPLTVRADRVELCEYPSLETLRSWSLG